MPPPYFAHSGLDTTSWTDFQPLADHLRAVAAGARNRASQIPLTGLPEVAEAAGWIHDLGKYRSGFQAMLLADALGKPCPVPRAETFHKEAGAALAWAARNFPLALAVEGHHGGLRDGSELTALGKRDQCPAGLPVVDAVRPVAEPENDALRSPLPPQPAFRNPLHADLFTRVLFGCLVDADWADTAAHDRRVKELDPEPDPPALAPAERLCRVRGFIAGKAAQGAGTDIGRVRADILDACLARADDPPDVFSLTVPTGGGKTLASLAFALKHAARHGLRRVIYVAPYMTILEQNAAVIRAALGVGPDAPDVFEHYSLAEPPGGDDPETTGLGSPGRRAENWDAPVVVTTNVQFFESLFANQPGRCRKLPNVARSVVVLDECQSLPPGLVGPTCGMLRQLKTDLGCTVVLCTATQPAFDHPSLQADERLGAAEIIPPGVDLFARLKRVTVDWPKRDDPRLMWAGVADRMKREPAALCVVNTKKAARAVYDALKGLGLPGVYHLSTGMCPQHRREKLAAVRRLLDTKTPCYVVSTQLIEAGVDVDFPFLMREMGPLESIIQAAGRCNREGRLRNTCGDRIDGRVVVFRSQEGGMPVGEWYKRGRDEVEHLLFMNGGPQIDDPKTIRDYFRRLYYSGGPGGLDGIGIQPMRRALKFRSVAEAYRLIDNPGEPVVVATWESHRAEIANLLAELAIRPRRAVFRALARFQVNLLPSQRLRAAALLHEGPTGVTVWDGRYDEDAGIVEEMADEFII